MGQLSGTTDTYRIGSGGGIREDLEDVIWDLFAEDTYLLSNLDKVDAKNTYHEHLLDSLAAPTANRQIEGDDAAFVTIAAPTRVGNYLQISRKTFIVSGTLEEVAKAGRKKEATRQMMKQMRELKNDMEYALARNQASDAGGSGTGRSTGGMESWIATNEVLATTTSNATTIGFAAGVVAAPTDGTTTAALTENALKSALQAAWEQGGRVSEVLVGATQKNAIDAFSGQATRQIDVSRSEQLSVVAAVNLYVSSYGTVKVRLHRHVRSSVVLCIDPDYWAVSFLRRPFHTTLAQTGDGQKHMLLAEFGLVSRQEKASAKVVACS
jgi:hypothetical protein